MKQEKLAELIMVAELWAIDLHRGQKYNNKDYFSHHICEVVNTVAYLTHTSGLSRTDRALLKVVAYLHDSIEDTSVTVEEIRQRFGTRVAQSVLCLTRLENEDYDTAIARALRDDLAVWVKKADNLVNLRESIKTGNKRLIHKYLSSLATLNDV